MCKAFQVATSTSANGFEPRQYPSYQHALHDALTSAGHLTASTPVVGSTLPRTPSCPPTVFPSFFPSFHFTQEQIACVCEVLPEQRQHRPSGQVPLVLADLRPHPQQRERAEGKSGSRLRQRSVQGALQDPGKPLLHAAQPSSTAESLVEGALRGSGKAARATPGSGG